jgi:hypothetical protein
MVGVIAAAMDAEAPISNSRDVDMYSTSDDIPAQV